MKELFYCVLCFVIFTVTRGDDSQHVALRYGFHKTDDCQNFEKAFLCVRQCLDLKFDLAYANKNCDCTCHKKENKAKYTPNSVGTQTKYKLGAPTTTVPAWAQKSTRLVSSQQPDNSVEKAVEDHLLLKEPASTMQDKDHSAENHTYTHANPTVSTSQVTEYFNEAKKTEEIFIHSTDKNTHETMTMVTDTVSETEALVTEAN